jgi:hypothetical protein
MKRGHCCIGLPLQKPGLASCEVAQPTWPFSPWDRNRGLDPHPPAGSSLAKSGWPAAARRAWCYWAGSRGGEGPDSDSPGSSSRGRLGSWLGLRSTVARGTRLGCSSAMAYRCIAAAEQSKEREQREEEAKWWRSPLPTHA